MAPEVIVRRRKRPGGDNPIDQNGGTGEQPGTEQPGRRETSESGAPEPRRRYVAGTGGGTDVPGSAPAPRDASAAGGDPSPTSHDAGRTADDPSPASHDAGQAADDPSPAHEEDFATMLAASEAAEAARPRLSEGARVRGRVVAIGPTTAFVAIGDKAEATIDLAEFRDAETGEVPLAVGDRIEGSVTDDGSRSGSVVIKRTLGRGSHLPGELEQAHAHGIPVEGLVTGQNKGGFDVQVAGQRAFCPSSQIDLRRADPAQYVGQRFRFRVTQIAGGRNIVVSRRHLLEEENAQQAAEAWQRLKVGDVVQGTVRSVRDFGAFVDLGGVEGLIHVSEIGHGRAAHPSEALQVGQTVEAQIMKLEPPGDGGRGRISLSIRALAPDPWSTAVERFPVGTAVRGKVRRIEPFGAFVELEPGLDGLVHVSRMSLDRRVSNPKQIVNVGDEVDVTVVGIESDKRRIALSMVENARRERDGAEAAEREETRSIASQTRGKSLGTFADLLAASRKKQK